MVTPQNNVMKILMVGLIVAAMNMLGDKAAIACPKVTAYISTRRTTVVKYQT